jgi:dTDP-4-amino-4,6-dideoxygalactose transaminase
VAERIPVARPWLGEEEAAAARRAILSGWLTQGPEVAAFEREFAEAVGAAHACAVSSCTAALHLALLAVGVTAGDEVVTVSHSFIATANSIRYCGATPVFVDIEPGTFNMDAARVEAALGPRTRAILCVHQMGMPCDLAAIVETARRRGIAVVEDAACAAGSEILWSGRWERIGRPHGDIACFSFHPRKLLTTGDGGMLTTRDARLDSRFRLWRQHGMSVPDTARHTAREAVFECYPEPGYNYRMTDTQAAVGREQLKRLPAMVERRRYLAARYREGLRGGGCGLPEEPLWARSNWQSYCVRLPEGRGQREAMQTLLAEGISTRRGIMCAHLEAAWPTGTWRAPGGLAMSEQARDRGLILPLFHELSEAQQDRVVAAARAMAGAG